VKDKFIAAVFAVLAAKLHKRKFVYWISYPYPEASIYDAKIGVARFPALYYIRGHFFDFLLYRIISKGASHIFVQSEQMKKDFMARGVPGEKMTPVPMGFSMRAYQEWQKSSPDKDTYGEVEIAYLGTLVGTRHMDFMVRVLEKVREQIPSARLLFVGDGETEADRKIIENEAERLGLSEAVIITGFMPQIEALRLIQAAKVCVSPFYPTPVLLSTSPTKLIEYMALGKAVVANDHPEQSEVIAASGGGVSVPWDEQAFADAIVGLVNNKTLREEMGQKGLAFVKAHRTYDTIVDPVERRLEQTLSE
jgi:glycosyltransferase involved in cell wall biosynthesis